MLQPPELLKKIPLFQAIPDAYLEELADKMSELDVKKGAVLFRKGSTGTALYVIQKGAIKIVLPSKIGEKMIVAIFKEGDFLGELSLLDHEPRSADAVAIMPSRLFLLERQDFFMFLKTNDEAMRVLLASLSNRIRNTDSLLEDTCFLNIPARFAKKLLELGDTFGRQDEGELEISLKITQKDLAGMIGASRESVNKELRQLRERGIIDVTARAIRIVDPVRLKRRTE